MKLILTQQVAGLGGPGDVIEVKDGYGRNYLVPRQFAIQWTKGAEKQIAVIKKARAAREIATLEQAKEIADSLKGLKVAVKAQAGKSGRLFGAVTAGDIAEAVKAAGGPDIDKRRIEIGNPIKTTGSHQVTVRLHPEVAGTVNLNVA
ncbi:50S ribosomal protein L9 [Actinocorallia longicatena]|uniref:Large ribosomal subunit protein bL9 n=1 Tax=Actinocorallia longicatena TaxID=111803 RepID=A0ABP6QD02_9ACTN